MLYVSVWNFLRYHLLYKAINFHIILMKLQKLFDLNLILFILISLNFHFQLILFIIFLNLLKLLLFLQIICSSIQHYDWFAFSSFIRVIFLLLKWLNWGNSISLLLDFFRFLVKPKRYVLFFVLWIILGFNFCLNHLFF